LRPPRQLQRAAAALLAGVLALSGCGGGGAGQTGPASHPQSHRQASTRSASSNAPTAKGCGLAPLVHALDTLEGRLAAGLSYGQYFREVKGARDAYETVAVEELGLPCLGAVGTPAEKALDRYIEAANTWRACRTDVRCGTYSIEPRLQRAWRVASHFLGEIR
jgi:hypothetical protein